MCLAAHPFFIAFNRFPPTAELGRMTTPHAAAEIGVTMVIAALAWMMLSTWTGALQRRFVIGGCAVYFALLADFQVHVQSELVRVWQQQKDFWRAIVHTVPDIEPGSLVIVDPFKNGWVNSGAEQRLNEIMRIIIDDPSSMVWNYDRFSRHIPWSPRHVLPQTPEKNLVYQRLC